MSVLAILEQRGGKSNRVSFEALAAAERIAQALGVPVVAVVLGSAVEAFAREAVAEFKSGGELHGFGVADAESFLKFLYGTPRHGDDRPVKRNGRVDGL